MFSHIMVGANDIDSARTFYDATLGAIGYGPPVTGENGRFFYVTDSGVFCVGKPIDGEVAGHGNGGTIGFAVDTPEAADAWHAAGLANGGTACEDAPGVREAAQGNMYLAYLRDPTGNKLCVLCRM
jgi:catechol 2,3-dioxygenase-like lactoylglutathione lyase family enzyme